VNSPPPIWLLGALPAVGVFASSIYLPSIPAMALDLQVPAGQIQFTITVYLAAMAACMLIIGPLSDRLGRRRIALGMLFLFLLGSVGSLLAANVHTLVMARLVQGMGASGGIVLTRSMLRDAYCDADVIRAGATMSMTISIAPILAPMVGGLIQQAFGWRANMLLIVVLAVTLFVLAFTRMHETLPAHKRTTGTKLHMALGYAQLLRMRAFMAYALPVALGAAAIFAYQTEAPVLLIGMLQVSAAEYGIYGALPAVGFIMGSFITRRLATSVNRGTLIQVGCGLCCLSGLLMTGLALGFAPTALAIAAPMIVFGLGNGLVMPSGNFGSMRAAPAMLGTSAALSGCMRMGSGSLGSLLATTLPNGSVVALGVLIISAALAATLAWRVLGRDLE